MAPKKKEIKVEDEATIAARRKEQQAAAKKILRERMEAEQDKIATLAGRNS